MRLRRSSLGKFVDRLQHAIQTTGQPIFDNTVAAILTEEDVYNAMVGARIVAQQMGLMRVQQKGGIWVASPTGFSRYPVFSASTKIWLEI